MAALPLPSSAATTATTINSAHPCIQFVGAKLTKQRKAKTARLAHVFNNLSNNNNTSSTTSNLNVPVINNTRTIPHQRIPGSSGGGGGAGGGGPLSRCNLLQPENRDVLEKLGERFAMKFCTDATFMGRGLKKDFRNAGKEMAKIISVCQYYNTRPPSANIPHMTFKQIKQYCSECRNTSDGDRHQQYTASSHIHTHSHIHPLVHPHAQMHIQPQHLQMQPQLQQPPYTTARKAYAPSYAQVDGGCDSDSSDIGDSERDGNYGNNNNTINTNNTNHRLQQKRKREQIDDDDSDIDISDDSSDDNNATETSIISRQQAFITPSQPQPQPQLQLQPRPWTTTVAPVSTTIAETTHQISDDETDESSESSEYEDN